MKNPWEDFDSTAPRQVHAADSEAFDFFNSQLDRSRSISRENFRLQHHVSPQPYFGNQNGKLLLLLANPAYLPGSDIDEETPEIRHLFDLSRRHRLTDTPLVYFRPELQKTQGYKWWAKRLNRLIEAAGLEVVTNQVFSVELHAYKSQNYKRIKSSFATQEYTRWLVRESMSRGAYIILGRSENEWLSAIDGLSSYRNLVRLNSVQNAAVTPKNMPEGKFEDVVEAIRHEHQVCLQTKVRAGYQA